MLSSRPDWSLLGVTDHARLRWKQRVGLPIPRKRDFIDMLSCAERARKLRLKNGQYCYPYIGTQIWRLEDVVFVVSISRVTGRPWLSTVIKQKVKA